ncbi:hypothetical protein NAP1_10373 [Erythrobacter sp. NAP1]|uniref:hypothetical protein n=1 Tax=Erythrobacter sp. NAP1 TaxID=237727 RepID=UPI0000687763|nr:hypothetical protein [Erythrobacter sp. NAP1]EAQ27992.1 hypothetical protein NAP1_10373 [Erythrobacter sp. NAP1]
MTQKRTRLLLVYNADSGIINALKDAVWKIASPKTYPCSLCAITYGAVLMHNEWRRFLDSLPMEVVFHHKDDFEETFSGHRIALPTIAIDTGDEYPEVIISNEELVRIETTTELMERVRQALVSAHFRAPELRIVA